MLEAYARAAPLGLERPIADLGCGTGLFAGALAARGVPDLAGGTDAGLDYLEDELKGALEAGPPRRPRLGVIRGDLGSLPFADGAFGGAVSNAVLSSFVGGAAGPEGALREVRRVLRPGGRFACSVATPAFAADTRLHRLARGLGREGAARRVEAWVSRRNDHTVTLTAGGWAALLERAGFEVLTCRPIMGPGYARLYGRLALLKGTDVPRRLAMRAGRPGLEEGIGAAQGAAQSRLMRLALGSAFRDEAGRLEGLDPERAAFLLFVARRRD